MLWEHYGDTHHARQHNDLIQKQEQRHKGRSRAKIMTDMPDNVLGRDDRHNKGTKTVYEHEALSE